MYVFAYTNSLTLLLCETYVEEYNIRFNSSKSQLIHFTEYKKIVKRDISIEMKNGSKIKMVDECKYLGTTLYSENVNIHLM